MVVLGVVGESVGCGGRMHSKCKGLMRMVASLVERSHSVCHVSPDTGAVHHWQPS